MNKTTRTIITTLAALTLAAGSGFAGYTVGHNANAAETAQTVKTAQCDAIKGLSLAPIVPLKATTPACVWAYQTTITKILENPGACYCG